MASLDGGCLCGSVRYSSNAEPALVAVCHCKNCQKQSGTAFGLIVGVPRSELKLLGSLKTYEDKGDSGGSVNRNFCPDCGSPITTDVGVMPDLTFIKAGTLDDTSWLDPKMNIYCDSAQKWVRIPDDGQNFPEMPG